MRDSDTVVTNRKLWVCILLLKLRHLLTMTFQLFHFYILTCQLLIGKSYLEQCYVTHCWSCAMTWISLKLFIVDLLVSENADKKQINGSSSGILSGVVVCVKVLTYNSKTSYSYLLIRPTLEQSNQM